MICKDDLFLFYINSTFPGQNGHHFADDILRFILVNETFCILIEISPKFVSKGSINNDPGLDRYWFGVK